MSAGRLVIHVGLPKAASSALQFWCDAQRTRLLAEGVDYPDPRSPHLMRKHSRLVPELLDGHADTLAQDVAASRSPTVLVSNEGFSVRYPAFSRQARPALLAAAGGRRITLFLISREPGPWMRSLWAQGILNAPMQGRPPMTDAFEAFAARPETQRMLDLPAVAAGMQAMTGADQVVQATAEGDWLGALLSLLGVAPRPDDAPPRAHRAAPAHTIELVRRVMAQAGDQPGPVRMALLAAIEADVPTGNVTIANTALGFARRSERQQQQAARRLAESMLRVSPDAGEMAALHATISAWAAARMGS